MGNKSVKVGVNSRDLEERGVKYESTGFIPELPDYLGYVAAFVIVWLVYTSYQSAVSAMKKPITTISEHAVTIKQKVDEFTTEESAALEGNSNTTALAGSLASKPAEKVESSGWWSKIDRLNIGISRAVDYTAETFQEWFFEDDFEEPSNNPPVTRRARPKRPAKGGKSAGSEELEWF